MYVRVVTVMVLAVARLSEAQGLPADPLVYRGVVATGSIAPNTPMRVTLWRSATGTSVATDQLCGSNVTAQSISPDSSGRFEVPLAGDCVEAVRSNALVWVQLEINTVPVLPRTQLKAVPFAVKAERVVVEAGGNATTASGLLCGTTAPVNGAFSSGGQTGYRAAKLLCEQVSGCGPLAHMCSAEEMVRGRQLGLPFTEGWLATGLTIVGSPTVVSSDCGGWNVAMSTHIGPSWQVVSGGPYGRFCNEMLPILCCR